MKMKLDIIVAYQIVINVIIKQYVKNVVQTTCQMKITPNAQKKQLMLMN